MAALILMVPVAAEPISVLRALVITAGFIAGNWNDTALSSDYGAGSGCTAASIVAIFRHGD